MTRAEAKKLPSGVYRIWWRDDDKTSVAAVGRDATGDVWLAPANWINFQVSGQYWKKVHRVQLIEAAYP